MRGNEAHVRDVCEWERSRVGQEVGEGEVLKLPGLREAPTPHRGRCRGQGRIAAGAAAAAAHTAAAF